MPLILIINGPNLNMLGMREPEIYGSQTLADIEHLCFTTAAKFGMKIDFRQSNREGEIVGWIQGAHKNIDGLIINGAAYTHTSIAIHDALKLLDAPVVEVHLTDPSTREEFRHHSYIAPVAFAHFAGHGMQSYLMALETLAEKLGLIQG